MIFECKPGVFGILVLSPSSCTFVAFDRDRGNAMNRLAFIRGLALGVN